MGSKNPFTPGERTGDESPFAEPTASAPVEQAVEPADETREIEAVPASMWTVAGYLLLVLLLGLCSYSLLQQKRANDALASQLAERGTAVAAAEQRTFLKDNELTEARAALEELQTRIDTLAQAQEAAAGAQRDMETELRAALASKDITISELQGKLTLSILDRILFDSGQAVIKPGGQEVLRKLAAVLDQFPQRQIHVTGHTDNVPIHTAQFPSNWELSAARALAAVRFLVEQAGVHPARLAAVAHGEFQPLADNTTPEGRAQNRRITIVVLPEVFKSPEAPPPRLEETATPPVEPLPVHGDSGS
jgi:flagellar motor protein MotB